MTAKRKPEQPDVQLIQGHVLDVLAGMEAESVSCVVTSPPYWSQRKYEADDVMWSDGWTGQLGLEPTVEQYVEHTVEWFRAVHRVLRPDGVCWVNLGDGYASNPAKGGSGLGGKEETWHRGAYDRRSRGGLGTLKEKDLVLMPFRVALAAQAAGWWVRSVVIWNKPNCMPESCKDRPTTAHEYVLFLTKSANYWYDSEAVREVPSAASMARISQPNFDQQTGGPRDYGKTGINPSRSARKALENFAANPGRNMRSVWTFPTAQTREGTNFAVFPEELPRRCILASAPQAICSKCGVARMRVVARPQPPAEMRNRETATILALGDKGATRVGGGQKLQDWYEANPPQTTGWTSCKCKSPSYVPGLVLDPFAGVGTTGVVARRLGRRFVGIELSKKYCRMATKRMEQGTLGIPL